MCLNYSKKIILVDCCVHVGRPCFNKDNEYAREEKFERIRYPTTCPKLRVARSFWVRKIKVEDMLISFIKTWM